MGQLLEIQYWFDSVPGSPNLLFWRSILVAATALLVIAIIASIMTRKQKSDALRYKLWFRIASWGYTTSIVFGTLAFFRFQQAYLLSMRAFVFTWIVGTFVWLGLILKYAMLDLPKKIKKRAEAQAFKQYLPQRKQ